MELNEGTYTLPPELKAVVINGVVHVIPRKRRVLPDIKHCKDCEWQRMGRKCNKNQWHDAAYCIARPKTISGESGYFYCAPDSRVACYLFKQKANAE